MTGQCGCEVKTPVCEEFEEWDESGDESPCFHCTHMYSCHAGFRTLAEGGDVDIDSENEGTTETQKEPFEVEEKLSAIIADKAAGRISKEAMWNRIGALGQGLKGTEFTFFLMFLEVAALSAAPTKINYDEPGFIECLEAYRTRLQDRLNDALSQYERDSDYQLTELRATRSGNGEWQIHLQLVTKEST